MGKWDYCARGVILSKNVKKVDLAALEGVDFVINDIGSWGVDFDKDHAKRLDFPYALDIPVILKIWLDYLPFMGRGYNNEANWPTGLDEEHIATLDRALFFGGALGGQPRYYHSILWDMLHITTADGKVTFTDGWIAKATQHDINTAYSRYHLNQWALFSGAKLAALGDAPTLKTALAKWGCFNPMSCREYAWVAGDVVVDKFSDLPRPSDDYGPNYLFAKDWGFWQASNEKFRIRGVTDDAGNPVYVPVVLFNGGKEALHKALNFTPRGTVVTPPPAADPVTPPPETGDYAAVLAELRAIRAAVEKMAGVLK